MPTVSVPPRLIAAELARYLAEPHDDPPAAYLGAARHKVLPLLNDFMGCWALSTSGQLMFFAWDAPDQLDTVSDRPVDVIGTHVALAIGSRRYPPIAHICPERPSDAIPCSTCDGSGRISGAPDNLICACGGLGWMPATTLGAT